MEALSIGYDREQSTEFNPVYFVYDALNKSIIYRGTYTQCLCILGAFSLDSSTSLDEIRNKTNGYV